jgi:hypothetical protein
LDIQRTTSLSYWENLPFFHNQLSWYTIFTITCYFGNGYSS